MAAPVKTVGFLLTLLLTGASLQLSLGIQLFCPNQTTTRDPASPTLVDSSSDEEEQYSGRPYALRCCVSGNPTPSIEWEKDGRPVSQHFISRTFEMKENQQVLDIRQVLPGDTGNYTCRATNQYGHYNWTIDFYVISVQPDRKPSVRLSSQRWTAEEGGSIILQCHVTGSSSRPVITWLKEHSNKSRSRPRQNGTRQTVNRLTSQSDKWFSNLTIDQVTFEDAGRYICQAKNGLGQQGPPSEEAGHLQVLTAGNVSSTAMPDSRPFSSAAFHWGLVTIAVVALVVVVGGVLWLFKRRRRKPYMNLPRRCHATKHGQDGHDDCICQAKYDVFISYNSADKEWVNGVLKGDLCKKYRVCMDTIGFEPGKYITDNIVHSIWVSRKILLVITRNFLQSEWCCFEKQIAQGKVILCKDSLIVIMLEDLKLKELPKDLRHYKLEKTYLEWHNEHVKPHFWKRLHDAIGPSTFPPNTQEMV